MRSLPGWIRDRSALGRAHRLAHREASGGTTDAVMLHELVELHARVLQRIPFVQILVVAGIGAFVLRFVPVWLFAGWAALSLIVEIVRGATATWLLRRKPRANAARMHRIFIAEAALAGTAVGLGAVVFLPRIPIERQAVLGIVLFAMPAAGVAVAVASRAILLAYSACILVPAAATWAVLHRAEVSVLWMTGVYLVFLAIITADGERLLMRSVAIRQQHDRVLKALEQSNAEVRAAMQRAEDAAQARARVLAAASHDLRQPLHALSLYSALLRSDPDPVTLKEVGDNVDEIVQSLGKLLNGLFDLSRLSSGAYVLQREMVQLDQLAAQVCREFDVQAQAKGLTVVRESAPVHALVDPLAVARVLRNLLDNAIKYAQRGEVRVIVRADGADASLSVVDSGKGIRSQDLPHIFEEFYQADNPGRDRSRGVGLGLAIVQRLVELMGAAIEVDSMPGRGSRFTVTLHRAVAAASLHPDDGDAAYPVAPGTGEPEGSLRGLRIYVVDDEIAILRSLDALLKNWGAVVHVAIDGHEAQALFEQHGCPDLLLIDLRLGGSEHGGALATRLRAAFGRFAVLVVTGEAAAVVREQASQTGYAVLQKPLPERVLRRAITDAVSAMAGRPGV